MQTTQQAPPAAPGPLRSDSPPPVHPVPTWRKAYAVIAVAGSGLVLVPCALSPALREVMRAEDRAIEACTVLLYVAAIVVALAATSVSCRDRPRTLPLAFAGLAAFGALEELSYGQRFFGIERPWVAGMQIDSAHDLVLLGVRVVALAAERIGVVAYVLVLAAAAVAAAAVWRWRDGLRRTVRALLAEPAAVFILVCAGMIIAATSIDTVLHFWRGGVARQLVQLLEELLEANAALALVFGAALCFRLRRSAG